MSGLTACCEPWTGRPHLAPTSVRCARGGLRSRAAVRRRQAAFLLRRTRRDVFFTPDSGGARRRRGRRPVPWRARRGALVGRRRVRQAAADDGAAVRHAVDRDQPRLARPTRRRARSASVPGPCSAGCGALRSCSRSSFPWPSRKSRRHRSSARPCSSAVRRSTSSISTSRRIRSTRSRTTSSRRWCCSRSIVGVALIGVERKQALLDVLRVAADAVARATRLAVRLTPYRAVRHRRDRGRHPQHRAARAAAGLSRHLRGGRAAGQPLGPARAGRRTDTDSGHARSSR